MSSSNCCFLTCIQFLKRRVRWSGIPISFRIFHSLLWSTQSKALTYCSHEIKRRLLLGKKVMTNLDSIFKSRDITLPTKVRLVKAMVFPVVMYGCESWTVKMAEHWRIDAFELCVVLEKTLESPLDCKKIQPVHSEGDQPWDFFGRNDAKAETPVLLMQRVDSLEKTLMLGGIGGRRRRDDRGWDGWMASLTRWTWVWVNSGSWCWTGRPGVLRFMGSQRVGHEWATELNWTDRLLKTIPVPEILT